LVGDKTKIEHLGECSIDGRQEPREIIVVLFEGTEVEGDLVQSAKVPSTLDEGDLEAAEDRLAPERG